MSDKHLSGEEKRRLLKEQFKEDLRQRKEFLEKMKSLRHVNRINKALNDMNIEDDTDEWIEKLNSESAFSEAKMEMAMDTVTTEEKVDKIHQAELEKIVAEEMVRELKKEMAREAGVIDIEIHSDEITSGISHKDTPAKESMENKKPLIDLDQEIQNPKEGTGKNPERNMLDDIE